MEYYTDGKWKLSKDDPNSPSTSSSSSKPAALTMMRSMSQRGAASSNHPSLHRSYSHRNPAAAEAETEAASSSSKSGTNFGRKCKNLAKEQKAKFYIVKRCIAMLVRRNKHRDDDDEDDS